MSIFDRIGQYGLVPVIGTDGVAIDCAAEILSAQ